MKAAKKSAPVSERTIKAKKLPAKVKNSESRDGAWHTLGSERFAAGYPVSSLEDVRRAYKPGMTQEDMAEAMGVTQSLISRLERRESLDAVTVETLRRYVEGLGGKLELIVTFPSGHRTGLGGATKPQKRSA